MYHSALLGLGLELAEVGGINGVSAVFAVFSRVVDANTSMSCGAVSIHLLPCLDYWATIGATCTWQLRWGAG
ncbi:hypothetical protein CC85DRAFT_286756 [Cutaneotrichosporon oleaginosum]|uniref:Uncharacterized protein n=1 Tax=Cutaneotrichosporon oleaginosum TaxID=879819 RepID=A0A0J1B0R5_9TREE|nr:uncharacterized protein CC85DRAFT_286756 [Cutaneotrichosporon oleaginosum]KLT41199.1 hypothetical protein CC85DRAFT_286756 [Cutaneotrichosporon oleaginosum]